MKLYHWRDTTCNQLYSCGDIIVMASSLEEAREVALRDARIATLATHNMSEIYDDLESLDPEIVHEACAMIDAVTTLLRADLEKPPFIYETAKAIFIDGGE